MLSESIRDLKNTLARKFDQLEQTLTQQGVWNADDEECDVLSHSNHTTESTGGSTTADEPPSERQRSTPSSGETISKQKVLNSIAGKKMQMLEKVD